MLKLVHVMLDRDATVFHVLDTLKPKEISNL